MAKVKYKEPSNYFPEDLMRELLEDGKKNREKYNAKLKEAEKKNTTNKSGKKKK